MKSVNEIKEIHSREAPIAPFGVFLAGYRTAERQWRRTFIEFLVMVGLGVVGSTAFFVVTDYIASP